MANEREIPLGWIERVLESPTFEEPDVEHAGATCAYAPIIEFGNRMLRVVYYDTGSAVRVITLFFDRRDQKEPKAMRMTVDEEADALYIRFDEATIIESEEVSPGIILDFDSDGRVVGFEMLSVRKRFPNADLSQMEVAQL